MEALLEATSLRRFSVLWKPTWEALAKAVEHETAAAWPLVLAAIVGAQDEFLHSGWQRRMCAEPSAHCLSTRQFAWVEWQCGTACSSAPQRPVEPTAMHGPSALLIRVSLRCTDGGAEAISWVICCAAETICKH